MTLGVFCALGCALAWSIAVILFKKADDSLSPVVMNLFKNFLGFALMVPTVWIVEGAPFLPTAGKDLVILAVSGILGIGVADALVLKSLSLIGATRWAIVECLYSPIIIVLSILFLGESLGAIQFLGAAMVLSAVLCVTASDSKKPRERRTLIQGCLIGAAGLVSMAVGILLVKPLFVTVPLLWVIEARLLAGVIGSVGSVLVTNGRAQSFRSLLKIRNPITVVLASLFSTYIAMIMWVAGFKYNQASEAAVLNQTATIFTVVLAVVFLRERVTWRKVLGTVLAMGGVLAMTVDWG